MRKFIAYRITNCANGKVYIGITTRSLEERWADHKENRILRVKHPLYRAVNKYGRKAFLVDQIAECRTLDDLLATEKTLIAQYDCLFPKGYHQ